MAGETPALHGSLRRASVLIVISVVKSEFPPKGREFFADALGDLTPLGKKFAARRRIPDLSRRW
jgi:hypothetical protein